MKTMNEMFESSTRAEDLAGKVGEEVLYLVDDGRGDLGYCIPTISRIFVSDVDEETDELYGWDDYSDGSFVVDPPRTFLTRFDLHEMLATVGQADADIIDEEMSDGVGVFAAHARGARGAHATTGCALADQLSHCDALLCAVYDDGEAEAFVPVFFDEDTRTWRCVASGYERDVESELGEGHIIVPVGDYERAVEWMMDRFARFLD